MDPFWISWIAYGSAAVLATIVVFGGFAEAREEASDTAITAADCELLRSLGHEEASDGEDSVDTGITAADWQLVESWLR